MKQAGNNPQMESNTNQKSPYRETEKSENISRPKSTREETKKENPLKSLGRGNAVLHIESHPLQSFLQAYLNTYHLD